MIAVSMPPLSGFPPALVRRLVIKIGSALLVDPAGQVRVDWLRTLVADVAVLPERRAPVAVELVALVRLALPDHAVTFSAEGY